MSTYASTMPREYSRNCANTSSTLSSSSPRATFAQTHAHTRQPSRKPTQTIVPQPTEPTAAAGMHMQPLATWALFVREMPRVRCLCVVCATCASRTAKTLRLEFFSGNGKYPSRPTFACKALHRWYSMITRARSRLHRLRPAQVGPRLSKWERLSGTRGRTDLGVRAVLPPE